LPTTKALACSGPSSSATADEAAKTCAQKTATRIRIDDANPLQCLRILLMSKVSILNGASKDTVTCIVKFISTTRTRLLMC
jgi:hypothetical protein